MKSKKYEIMLSVLTIMTVLTTSVGVSFAYFTGSFSGTPASVDVTTDRIGGVIFEGGANFTTANEIEPPWNESKTFTIKAAPSNYEQTIYVKMKYTNEFKDLECRVTTDGTNVDSSITNTDCGLISASDGVEAQEKETILVTKTFPASTELQSVTYTLTMTYPDSGENQNYDQGKEFNATLFADLGSNNLYYTNSNPNGTTTKPTAQ